MSALCRNTQMCVKHRFKSWLTIPLQQWRRNSHSWENRLPVRRHQGVLLEHGTCSNFIAKRQLQISAKVTSNLHVEDVMTSQIATATTADSIFVTLSSIDDLTPPHIVVALGALDKLMDEQLVAQPWAISADPTLRFVQSLMNSEAREMYDPILQCPEFDRLCFEAQKCRTMLSNSELISVTLHMMRMHVDVHSEHFRNLLCECQLRLQQCDLETLVHFASIANFLKRPGFILSAQIAQILQQRWNDLDISEQNLLSIIKLLHNVGYFISKETLIHYQKKILEMLKKHHATVAPDKLIELLEALSRFAGRTKLEIKEIAMLQVKKRLDDLDCWYIPRIAFQLLHNVNGNNNELLGMLSKHTCSVLTKRNKSLRPADVVALVRMSHLIKLSPSSMKILEFLLEDRMRDLDAMLLKYASISNPLIFASNAGLVQAFCEQVQHKVKDLLKSLSCLLAVTHCLAKIPTRPPEFDRVYAHHLIHHVLDQQLGAQPKHIATIGRYLVQCFQRSDLRSVGLFTAKLIQSLPRLTLIDIANVGLGISSFENIAVRSSYEQIITNFSREILLRSNEIENIAVLNVLMKSVFLKLSIPFRDAIIGDLEELYVIHSPSLTLQSVKHTCHLLKHLRLNIKTINDYLVAIIISSNFGSTASLSDIANVLDLLIRVNYRPTNIEAIQELATAKISKANYLRGPDLSDVLVIANSLASFQMFPEDIIKRVFSLNFLMALDTWNDSTTSSSRSQQIYSLKMLSDLNRSVMLQCPQLSESVAWFCDRCTKPSYSKLDSNTIARWKSSVYAGLIDALGGSEYVKMGPLLTPYNHSYDFECVLDKTYRPLILETDQEHIRYRVAVLLMTPTNYCKNSRTLSGHMMNKVLQMEILGFKVVTIPYSHLDSMMLSDPDSRQKYFYDAIVDGVN